MLIEKNAVTKNTEQIISLINNAPFLTILIIFTFLVIWFTLRMRLRVIRFVETSIVSIINKELGKKINIVNKEINCMNEEIQSLKADLLEINLKSGNTQPDVLTREDLTGKGGMEDFSIL